MFSGNTGEKIFFLGLLLSFLLLISCVSEQDDKLTVAVAANLQFAIEELVEKFSDQ